MQNDRIETEWMMTLTNKLKQHAYTFFFFLVYQEGMVNQETECNLSFLISIKAKKIKLYSIN